MYKLSPAADRLSKIHDPGEVFQALAQNLPILASILQQLQKSCLPIFFNGQRWEGLLQKVEQAFLQEQYLLLSFLSVVHCYLVAMMKSCKGTAIVNGDF